MKPDLCIYHSPCADGFGAAWAVWKRFGNGVEYFPGVYGQQPPNVVGKNVVIVDFSYKRPVLETMATQAKSILILDHHKTAAEDLAGLPTPAPYMLWQVSDDDHPPLSAVFDMNRSGAGMAWDYFHPGKPRPRLLNHVEDRDLWRFELPHTKPVSAVIFSHPYTFEAWDEMAVQAEGSAGLHTIVAEGDAIERKMQKDIAELLGQCTRPMVIGGHTVPVANLPYTMASEAAGKLCEGVDDGLAGSYVPPFAACYFDRADARVFSLRSRGDFDVSAIAKQYGGGGHKNAAGFQRPIGWEGDGTAT